MHGVTIAGERGYLTPFPLSLRGEGESSGKVDCSTDNGYMEVLFLLSVAASLTGLLLARGVASARGWPFRFRRFAILLSMFGGMAAVVDAALVFGGGITFRLVLLYVFSLGFQLSVMAGMLSVHYWMAGRTEQEKAR